MRTSLPQKPSFLTFYFSISFCSQRDNEAKNADDVLFDMFRNEATDLLPIGKFLAALRTAGIRMHDPRIKEMMENLRKVHRLSSFEGGTSETQKLNRETFKSYVVR